MKKSKYLKTLGAALAVSSLAMVGNVSAWGPERSTFTMETPATYPTFNSITDNPTIGDERNFVRIAEINDDETNLKDSVEVVPGKQYLVYIYFHNNASSTFNDSAHNHSGIATGVKMASSFTKVLTPESSGEVTGTITAENTNPESVWDEASMTTTYKKVLMSYVAGSAKIYNDFETNDTVLSTDLFNETGTYLTLKNSAVGAIPGCEEYHGVVTYVLQAKELSGTVDKTVSLDGENFSDSVDAKPGDTLTYKLTIKNTGDRELTNAVIRDALPEGLTLVSGSVKLMANNSGTWDSLSDELVGNGFNLGTVGTGNTIEITYQATVDEGFNCDGLENTATFTYDSDQESGDSDTDSVTVNVDDGSCAPVEEETCETNPNLPGCSELPDTGPVEVAMVVAIVLGIAGGGYYLYRSNRKLGATESRVLGKKGKK